MEMTDAERKVIDLATRYVQAQMESCRQSERVEKTDAHTFDPVARLTEYSMGWNAKGKAALLERDLFLAVDALNLNECQRLLDGKPVDKNDELSTCQRRLDEAIRNLERKSDVR